MAQLTDNTNRTFEEGIINELPVKAAVVIYRGSAIGVDSGTGTVRQLVAGDEFRGFALAKADNTSGSNGTINCQVQEAGLIELSVTGVTAITDINKPVYASDGNTFTLTASTNTKVGKVHRWVSGTKVIVRFGSRISIVPVTDSTGGTPNDTFAAIAAGGAYAQSDLTAIKNALATVAQKLNQILQSHQNG